jgi:GntR family transcriptional regulator
MDDKGKGPLFETSERFYLDANSPVPLYHQMEEIILERIRTREALDRMLPPEKDLMVIFDVSRATVKKTLDNLVAKGLLERRRALGTRVISQEITEDLGLLKSYTEEMASRNLQVRSEVLGVDVHKPDAHVRKHLRLPAGEATLRVRRLRGTSKIFPVVYLVSELPASLGLGPDEDFNASLYKLLEQQHRIPIEWAHEEISAGEASEEEAGLLDLAAGDTVLIMERTTYSRMDRVIEFVRGVYRPDHYKFSIRLKR